MRALLTTPPGGWANTSITQVELRAAQPDWVLVKMTAVGLNPADNFQIDGRYPGGPKAPFIVGRDGCGVVVQGDATGRWKSGDQVIVIQSSTTNLKDGTLCEQQWIAAENLARKPSEWSDAEAAAAPLVYQTAWKALVGVGGLQPKQTVVVTGASGGVGLACVQLARAYGATVVALSRSKDKQDRLLNLGAHHVFSPDEPHLKETIFDTLKIKGVNLVVDNVGGPFLSTALHLLGVHGRISVVGVLAGIDGVISIPALMFKRASIHGVLVSDDTPEVAQASWKQILQLMDSHQTKPVIDSEYSLDDAPAAFQKLNASVFGKVVVKFN